MDVSKLDSKAISMGVAAKLTGLRPKVIRSLIRDRTLAGRRAGRNYYTSRHACRIFMHGLVTCAPIHVQALVDAPTP